MRSRARAEKHVSTSAKAAAAARKSGGICHGTQAHMHARRAKPRPCTPHRTSPHTLLLHLALRSCAATRYVCTLPTAVTSAPSPLRTVSAPRSQLSR